MVADSFGCAGNPGFYAGDGWRGGGNVEYAAEAVIPLCRKTFPLVQVNQQ